MEHADRPTWQRTVHPLSPRANPRPANDEFATWIAQSPTMVAARARLDGLFGDAIRRDNSDLQAYRGEPSPATSHDIIGSTPSTAPRQLQISFAIGRQVTFTGITHLKQSLKALFASPHHPAIDQLVDDADQKKWTIGAVDVFNQIRQIATDQGWERTVAALPSGETHGPSLPTRDAHDSKDDKEAAMSTFMFSSVTLAQATLTLPDGRLVRFEARNNTDSGDHAEDGLMRQIDAFLKTSGANPRKCRLRITINNAPCGRGKDEKNCSGRLAAFHRRRGFAHFRVYFMKPYGHDMKGSVERMRSGGISVGAFAPREMALHKADYSEGTWAKLEAQERITPGDYELDSASGSESERESDSDSHAESSDRSRSPEREKSDEDSSERRRAEERRRDRSRSPGAKGRRRARERRRRRARDEPRLEGLDLSGHRLFLNAAIDILQGPIALDGYQVGALLDLFDGAPENRFVHVDGVQFRIRRLASSLPKTAYNPDGLALLLTRGLRGG